MVCRAPQRTAHHAALPGLVQRSLRGYPDSRCADTISLYAAGGSNCRPGTPHRPHSIRHGRASAACPAANAGGDVHGSAGDMHGQRGVHVRSMRHHTPPGYTLGCKSPQQNRYISWISWGAGCEHEASFSSTPGIDASIISATTGLATRGPPDRQSKKAC